MPARHRRPAPRARRARLEVEALEARIVPYATTSNIWPAPQLVTLSFVPDGTVLGTNSSGYVYSNLFQKLNARFGSAAAWEGVIEKAAQSWAAVANVNFKVVSDNGTPLGQGAYQQGDPGMGDIRIGGYAFSNTYLGLAYFPPAANNYSAGGDVQLNTSVAWNNGSTYDLYTVAAHEIGHTLGLAESSVSTAVMYGYYNGVKGALTADDTGGVQVIYGGRPADAYNSGGASNQTPATAAVLTSQINPTSLTALVPNLDLTSPLGTEWFTFAAPQGASGSLTVRVQSTGLSLLTPAATLYAGDAATALASASGKGATDGATLTLSAGGVTPGQQYYVKVAGADGTAFSTGSYALSLNFGTGSSPAESSANTTDPNGSALSAGGGQAMQSGSGGGLLGGIVGDAVGVVSSTVKSLAKALGITFGAAQALLDGQLDPDAASAAAEPDEIIAAAEADAAPAGVPAAPANDLIDPVAGPALFVATEVAGLPAAAPLGVPATAAPRGPAGPADPGAVIDLPGPGAAPLQQPLPAAPAVLIVAPPPASVFPAAPALVGQFPGGGTGAADQTGTDGDDLSDPAPVQPAAPAADVVPGAEAADDGLALVFATWDHDGDGAADAAASAVVFAVDVPADWVGGAALAGAALSDSQNQE